MKRLLVLFVFLLGGFQVVIAQDADCDPAVVREWMVQRQMGRNQIEPLLSDNSTVSLIDGLLLLQSTRRTLEDLPRPACADELYDLTIFFYDTLSDTYTFAIANDAASATRMAERLGKYTANVEQLYQDLQAIAGVDIIEETAQRGSVAPTPAPTLPPPAPLQFEGVTGGTVVGPVNIPAGVYKLTLTGASIAVNITAVTGTCSGYIFVPSDATTTEKVFRSDGCDVLIEVAQTPSAIAWTLTFEPVS